MLFLDLDGVMFDFEGYFYQCFGVTPPSKGGVDDDELWRLVHGHGNFFREMPLFEGATNFFKTLCFYGFNPVILTAASKKHYHEMAVQKRAAVREKLTTDHLILPVWGSSSKALFMHAPGDIIIDDYAKNCRRWTDAGGMAIHHIDFASTLLRLGMIMGIDNRRKTAGLPFKPVLTEEDFAA